MIDYQRLIKRMAKQYVEDCWPDGVTDEQETDVILSFYAGMLSMFSLMTDITVLNEAAHGDVDDAGSMADLQTCMDAITAEANRLNAERGQG